VSRNESGGKPPQIVRAARDVLVMAHRRVFARVEWFHVSSRAKDGGGAASESEKPTPEPAPGPGFSGCDSGAGAGAGSGNPHEHSEFLSSRRSAAKDPEVLCEGFTPGRKFRILRRPSSLTPARPPPGLRRLWMTHQGRFPRIRSRGQE
jgi:hypothetical protein